MEPSLSTKPATLHQPASRGGARGPWSRAPGEAPASLRLLDPAPGEDTGDDDYLVRARELIEHAIRRRWAEGLLNRDSDGIFTSILGADHVERLLQPRRAEAGTLAGYAPQGALGALCERLGLPPTQADLLAVLLSCETDAACARLAAYVGGNHAAFVLTVELVFEIVYRAHSPRHGEAVALLQRDVGPGSLLRRLRFLVLDGAESKPALAQGIRLHPRLCGWLSGQEGLDAELASVARLHAPAEPVGECDPQALHAVTTAMAAEGRLVLINGPARSGREMLLRFAAARAGRPLLLLQGQGLSAERLAGAFREATLHDAWLGVREAEEALAGEGLVRLRECLEGYAGSVALIGAGRAAAPLSGLRPTTAVAVSVPPHGERLRLWQDYLGAESALTMDELAEVAALYNLGTAGIVDACQVARERAAFAGSEVERAHVGEAVREIFATDLEAVATRVAVTQGWEDLVLPDDVGESIVSILDRVRHRTGVLGDWGFARKLGKGLGLSALFSGEPGTGKSMAAGLIARDLGLDLYVVDLSRVMSKWLGETEKNLARAFDAAEAGHVLLLFDEADSVLGKRSSEMKSANDRYANLETNFILARLEQFQGVAIFTTNLPSAIDPAIMRRMAVRIDFPFPDEETRAELWRRMIPREAPLEDDIRFGELAERYELSGGFIRNIVMRAAYAAMGDGRAIGMHHLVQAAEQEYRERGCIASGGRLV